MSQEYEFINFEMGLLADAKFIPNFIFHINKKDYKCLNISKCSNFIAKDKFITGRAGFIQIISGCQVW